MKQTSPYSGTIPATPIPQAAQTGIDTPMSRSRVLWALGIFAFWVTLIALRLVWLQVFRHHDFVERAAKQQQRTFEVAPRRGVLYDRNLHEFAMTVLADSIYAVPSEIGDARPATAAALAKVVHIDPTDSFTSEHQILARFNASRNFAWVTRKQDPSVIEKVKALNLKGVYVQKEFKRFYPDNQMAAQVLGYVGLDDNGLGGLEQNFDDELHGVPGHMLTALDARRHVLGSQESEPLPGDNIVLSIDGNIQFMAEQELDRNMERTKSLNGMIVVQDPHTGQILALAVRPTFNPNDFRHATKDLLRNHAVSDVYEPGSTFKLVTYSAALEEKITTPDSKIETGGGRIVVAGRTVHDDNDAIRFEGRFGNVITITQALQESSDVAAVKLALRMGQDRFYQYIRSFGFGQQTGIELPDETRGLLKPVKRWEPTTIGSIPMGQEIGVTPVQLITMVSTIANGGMYLPPHILLESTELRKGDPKLHPITFHPGSDLPSPLPDGAHRVISTMTSAEMRKMMENVVLNGTGRLAQLNGYSAAGKTGTAQKIDVRTHTYSATKYIASFVGFAPVNNPAISVAVIMDSPEAGGHHGAQASAPAFHELAQQILEYLGVPHDQEMKAQIAQSQPVIDDDDHPEAHDENLNSLFAEVNDLPANDPLRTAQQTAGQAAPLTKNGQPVDAGISTGANDKEPLPAPVSAPPAPAVPPVQTASAKAAETAPPPPLPAASVLPQPDAKGQVTVNAGKRVAVPSLVGQPVRAAVEHAGEAGLGVQVLGTGIAREQAPAPGTMVPAGTEVVVRFTR